MCFEIAKKVDSLNVHQRIRQRAINAYYENPKYCKQCGNLIKIPCGSKPGDIRVKSFCDHSCAAKYNNLGVRRHKDNISKKCPNCGFVKDIRANFCLKCKVLETLRLNNERTLNDIQHLGASRARWNQLRALARQTLKLSEREYRCKFCDFNHKLHVAHIKPISSFSLDTKVGVVNSIDNLEYLCPNHHALYDNGLLDCKGNIKL